MKDQSKIKQTLIEKGAFLDDALEYAENIFDTVREPLIALDQDLRVVKANRSFYEFFRVKPEETVGQLIYDLGNKQWDIPLLWELLETIIPQKTTFDNYEVEHEFATIGKRTMLLNARQIKRSLGKERIILLAIEDITERKQYENLLKDSEELYRGVFNTASDGIFLLEKREGKIIHINPSAEKMLGYSTKESIGNKLHDVGLMFDTGDFQTIMQNLNKNGIINYTNVPLTTKSGQFIYTDIYLVNKTKAVQCNIRDVTGRKQAENDLKESENKYRLLADNILDVIFVLDMNLKFNYISPSVKLLTGYEPEDVIKQTPAETLTPSSYDLTVKTLAEIMEIEKSESRDINISRTLQLEMRRKDGTTVWTEMKASFIRDENQQAIGIMGVTRDITERKWANLKLEKQNKELAFQNEEKEKRAAELVLANKELFFQNEEKEKRAAELVIANKELEQEITARKQAEEQLHQTLEMLRKAFVSTIQVMVSAVEMRDPYTAGHQVRSADIAKTIAIEMGLDKEKIEGIRLAGTIHDIGKLSIPAEILSKPTKLTNNEISMLKEHSTDGYKMLKNVESPWPLAQIIYQHHERMNGSGYPRNLKGDEIIIEARIMAVADVVEAMASHRPYRAALGIEVALEEIDKNKGILYDHTVADACLKLFREKGYQFN